MNQINFSTKDIDQITKNGHHPDRIYSQLAMLKQGAPYVHLERPCTAGDGIRKLSHSKVEQCIHIHETRAIKKELIKFVPASGAATRMFKKLIQAHHELLNSGGDLSLMDATDQEALLFFMKNGHRFAFYRELETSIAKDGMRLETLLADQDYEKILRHLLTEKHLNYAALPKGLIQFHSYDNHSRTAFEEHLAEAGGYVKTDTNRCSLHFTVPPGFHDAFISYFNQIRAEYEKRSTIRFQVSFSTQQESTNTIAVDMHNNPFRRSDGSLLFRPGGHGALIHNLNQLDGDVIFIKNIDNVVHEAFSADTIKWKKVLCGYFIQIQERIFDYLRRLHRQPVEEALAGEISGFLDSELSRRLPADFESAGAEKKQKILIHLLDRPLRVCGMVPNSGDPGGGPFWTKDKTNHLSLQIVETSQIDTDSIHQKSILEKLTHFNPVDLVCGIKNWRGELFDLSQYVDHDAVFISTKSENGRDLKALELPGLWNGAMAYWNTIFVEVPKSTFNPVKEVTDLLKMHHQPAS